MSLHHLQYAPDIQALLETGKAIEPLPDIVRARALSRARGSVQDPVAYPLARRSSGRRRVVLLALAASMVLLVGVAGAVVGIHALQSRTSSRPPSIPSPVVLPSPAATPAPPPASTVPIQVQSSPVPQRSARPATFRESYAAELDLLHRAQAAYAGRDFADALTVVSEHRRRFPHGRLSEEREALRVRALIGAGRSKEAQAAMAAFAERFPRSVLLPRLSPDSD